jgi:hypothetical protein
MNIEEQSKVLEKFYYELFYGQDEIPKDFKQTIDKNYLELSK